VAAIVVGVLLPAAAPIALAGPAPAHPAPQVIQAAAGTLSVDGKGNGHGHGMAQYGAYGAALAGLTTPQILSFYYPGTTLTTLAQSVIRVAISEQTTYPTVLVPSGYQLSLNNTPLSLTGVKAFRLVPNGTGLGLQSSPDLSAWHAVQAGLPASSYFSSPSNWVQLLWSNGSSTRYRGQVYGLRSGSQVLAVNRVPLDSYAAGVAPREMPSSWGAAAIGAQAVAARTYGRNAVERNSASSYDICDYDQCQVYGGYQHLSPSGSLLWSEYAPAATSTANQVLRYNGQTILAQFSASNGGWTVGVPGYPYLVAKADPYDNAASGDPYLNWHYDVPPTDVAAYYGLARLGTIQITGRDGNGAYGGRVLTAVVNGYDASGAARSVSTTGFGLAAALGVPTNWFTINNSGTVPSAPTSVTTTSGDDGGYLNWAPPATDGGSPISRYLIVFGSHSMEVAGTLRRVWVGPLANGVTQTVAIYAINRVGRGAVATAPLLPTSSPQNVTSLAPARLFDSRTTGVAVDPTHPFTFSVPGHGGVPASGATAVQMALTIVAPSAPGVLRVQTAGTANTATSTITYLQGVTSTVTVSVPLVSSPSITFTPSAGSLGLVADVMSYSGSGAGRVSPVAATVLANSTSVPTGAGLAIPVAAAAGAGATGVVLSVTGTPGVHPGYLRIWNEGTAPGVSQVTVASNTASTNTVIVPIGSDGSIHIGSGVAGIAATVSLVGVISPTGRGRLETYQVRGVSDAVAGSTSLTVGTTPVVVTVATVSPIPPNIYGVLVGLTTTPAAASGALYAYQSDASRPAAPVMRFGGSLRDTATALVPTGTDGTITLVSSGPTVTVDLDSMGYLIH
jgi:hypothetical protein